MNADLKPDPDAATPEEPTVANGGAVPASKRLTARIARAVELQNLKAHGEAEAKEAARELADILKFEIPDLLTELGTGVWDTDLASASVATKIQGTITNAPDVEAAVQYLRDQGFGGAIKTVLTIEFDEEERELCASLATALSDQLGREVAYKRAIHAGTLAAWAREQTANGKPVALEKIGLAAWREAVVKPKTQKKGS